MNAYELDKLLTQSLDQVLAWSILWRFPCADPGSYRWFRKGDVLIGVGQSAFSPNPEILIAYAPESETPVSLHRKQGQAELIQFVEALVNPDFLPLCIGTWLDPIIECCLRDLPLREAA